MSDSSTDIWWESCLWGIAFLAGAAFFYWYLWDFEQSGDGILELDGPMVLPYGLGGKWAVVGPFTLLGVLMFYFGFTEFKESRSEPTGVLKYKRQDYSFAAIRRRIVLLQLVFPAMFSLGAWWLWGTQVVYCLDTRGRRGDEGGAFGFLIFALIFTVGCAIVAAVLSWRALGLFKHGVEVVGIVSSVSGSFREMVRIDYEYSFGEETFNKAKSEADGLYAAGDEIILIVDPKRPGRCLWKDQVFPKGMDAVDSSNSEQPLSLEQPEEIDAGGSDVLDI